MKTLRILIFRNVKLFFSDKAMFFTSLITPAILLLLYATFLGNVYESSFLAALPAGLPMAEELIGGCVGGQLISSILAVSCVTVSFCSNMLSVQDKALGAVRDFRVSPTSPQLLSVSYYISSLLSTLMICFMATALCLGYVAIVGWYFSVSDILFLLLDVILLCLFGTALSSVINHFLSTQGQISAVGSMVSSCYGFICGAYMPISQFSPGLQKVISFLPGTYGTSLVRNHSLRGVFAAMKTEGYPEEAIEGMKKVVDCNLSFFDHAVTIPQMYAVLGVTVILLIGIFILLNFRKGKRI